MPRPSRLAATTAVVSVALLAAGCTGSSPQQAQQKPGEQVTIKFWHGWSQKHEVKAINDNIAAFQAAHPDIKVVATGNVTDAKILQGLRSPTGPDVISSFTTDNVGAFCRGPLADLNPLLQKSGVDKDKVFVKTMIGYTQFRGNQCALPLLGDAMGLYYNKDAFAAAGITSPPKTFSEFKADAVKLTKTKGDSYSQLGFMPNFHGYQTRPSQFMATFGPKYLDSGGKSNLARDPNVAKFFTEQRALTDALGGYQRLEKYRQTFGEEYTPQNAFEAGKVAMQLDGEWRTANLPDDGVKFAWGTAPMPVPDDEASTYGRGYITGTIIGIGSKSRHQAAAWEFLKYLTTDTDALVRFANAIHNVPSTYEALKSPKLALGPTFQTFLDIAGHQDSSGVPSSSNGGQAIVLLDQFAFTYESGKAPDLAKGLEQLDKRIDTANAQS